MIYVYLIFTIFFWLFSGIGKNETYKNESLDRDIKININIKLIIMNIKMRKENLNNYY